MEKAKRARYTLEFKQEAVRLVDTGQTLAAAARSLGLVEQTLRQLGEGGATGKAEGRREECSKRRADGDQPVAGGTCAGEDGA